MTSVELHFGWRVAILALASVQILLLATAVAGQTANGLANRVLAAFLVVLVGVITPYTIGFAGAYDAWRWLTFAPFALPLALPPLLFGYAHALVKGRLPGGIRWHLAAPLLQVAYSTAAFLLPLEAKWSWYTGSHRIWVEPVSDTAVLVSFSIYSLAATSLLRRYRTDLAEQRSDDARFATGWLVRVIVAFMGTLVLYAVFTVWDWLSGGINFFEETGLYLSLAATGLYLGVEGWRRAAVRFPVAVRDSSPEVASPPEPDWAAVAADFDARTRAAGWPDEPDLSLSILARRLGTNTGRLSRAINQGLKVNFSAWINGLRAEAVAAALDAGATEDLLTLAFNAGFASKASFNRAFQARFGVAPSRYRRGVSDHDSFPADADARRAEG